MRQIFWGRSKNARSLVGRRYVTRDGATDRRSEPSAGRGRAGRFLVWRLSLLRVTVRRSMEPAHLGAPVNFGLK